jgi:hypothetical protein
MVVTIRGAEGLVTDVLRRTATRLEARKLELKDVIVRCAPPSDFSTTSLCCVG